MPVSPIPSIDDHELQLLRLFHRIDALPKEEPFGESRTLIVMTKNSSLKLLSQIEELSKGKAFRYTGSIMVQSPLSQTIYTMIMSETNTEQWREKVQEAIALGLLGN